MENMSAWLEVSLEHYLNNFGLKLDFSMKKEIGILFGPSGAGKSLTLRMIAGLDIPDRGIVKFDNRTLLDLPGKIVLKPQKRKVGLVFQELALFPHMTALDNVAYGLSGSKRYKTAESWLERVHLKGMEKRYPAQLSGGQKQRVALARSLAPNPDLLLLDEPFSALDGPLRRSLRRELKRLHRETGIPMLYVTHNIEDVCALGNHIFFIKDGKLTGDLPVEKLWDTASQENAWHALGWGNLLHGEILGREGRIWFIREKQALELSPSVQNRDTVTAFIPPHNIKILYPDIPVDSQLVPNIMEGIITEKLTIGSISNVYVESAGINWHLEFPSISYENMKLKEGDTVRISIRPGDITIMENIKGENSYEN